MELDFEGLEMQKWNILTDKAQTVDERDGVIYPVVMFTLRVMVIRMLKIVHFCIFSSEQQKVWVSSKYLTAPERSYSVLLENDISNRFLSYRSWDIEGRNINKLLNQQENSGNLYFEVFTSC